MNDFNDPMKYPTVEDEMLDYILARYDGAETAIETEEGIQILGIMPNTQTRDWYFGGTRNEIYRDMALKR